MNVTQFPPALVALLEQAADEFGVDRLLFACLVHRESGGDTYAYKPEAHYRYLWDVKANAPFRRLTAAEIASEVPPADFPFIAGSREQEWWAQQASWGLCQVMGAVARERGFRGGFLPELTRPEVGARFGAMHLGRLLKRFRDDRNSEALALAAYNAGDPTSPVGKAYAEAILKARDTLARELRA